MTALDIIESPAAPMRTLIDDLIVEQQQLTVVERFARKHARGDVPDQARYYRDLIPLDKPKAGEQYAFAVDLDACTGCKGCVSACHSLNGLDEDEIWRNVGLIHGGTIESPYQQTVTTACHHCVDPACLNGCPVLAFEKDAETGIVRHLDDQCIGCQYCVLKCPYDVPKYSKKRGIVRKCDMCYNRLAADEAPACVQACPNEAIIIRIVSKDDLVALTGASDRLLPDTFSSGCTKPTTAFTTRKAIPFNARAGDAHQLHLEHPHWPLIWMLVLTQFAAGMFVGATALAAISPVTFLVPIAASNALAFMVLNVGLAVSVLHLGRPLGAWRAFLGLRRSWMSREIIAFSLFAGLASGFTGFSLWPQLTALLPALRLLETFADPSSFVLPLGVAASTSALLGLVCSAMIYVDTRRPFWGAKITFPKFFGASLVLGLAGVATVLSWTAVFAGTPPAPSARVLAVMAAILNLALACWEFSTGYRALNNVESQLRRSTLTMWRLLFPVVMGRGLVCAAAAVLGLLAALTAGGANPGCATGLLVLTFVSILGERYSFFTAVDAPRMPGGVVT